MKTTYAHDDGELIVDFDLKRAEKQTLEYPGCAAQITVNSVTANGMDITYLLAATPNMMMIEAACWEKVSDMKEAAEMLADRNREWAQELEQGMKENDPRCIEYWEKFE